MFKQTPPMGWNSWNTFGANINEGLIREMADALVRTGLKEAGYEYVILDDGWQHTQRDENGRLCEDKQKFPSGIKALADYIHGKGLKFGMYSSSGHLTCTGFPASYGHEFTDAETFAAWEVDYLKYDYCNRPSRVPSDLLYQRMGLALANCGRDILFSACSWGLHGTPKWIKGTGASAWRSTGDIFDNWESIKNLGIMQKDLQPYNAINCFNDMDMLVVGMNGKGNVGLAGCTQEEYRTHFSMWAMLSSPLIIGADIRSLDEPTLSLLKNQAVIAVNQDPDGRMPFLLGGPLDLVYGETPAVSYARLLSDGSVALGMFNLDERDVCFQFSLTDLGVDRASGRTIRITDLWTGEVRNPVEDFIYINLKPHHCLIARAEIIKK